jgi:hypothetical protein
MALCKPGLVKMDATSYKTDIESVHISLNLPIPKHDNKKNKRNIHKIKKSG